MTHFYIYLKRKLLLGDIVLENLHPPIYDSQEFINNLMKVSKMDILKIVPGHGEIVTKGQIDVMLNYLYHLNAKVMSALEKDQPLEQLLSEGTPKEYSNWTGIDGYNRNLKTVYNEHK